MPDRRQDRRRYQLSLNMSNWRRSVLPLCDGLVWSKLAAAMTGWTLRCGELFKPVGVPARGQRWV
ncbi:hypothetical protein SBA3_1510009 [Candidatus Sulfopaludibacter sp. SbA3]|nr:hypothetical protein SBA3_1510009 [Candidatus Sulfopaludibacter sp. SbA3]